MKEQNIKAWAVVGEDGKVRTLSYSRDEARISKRLRESMGFKSKIVRLKFDSFVR